MSQIIDTKSYDFIISLGLNCETAFQINTNHGFVESSLLTWATVAAPSLPAILRDNSRIFAGKITPLATCNMFKCEETQTVFHGRTNPALLMDVNGTIPVDALAQEQSECQGRVKHLAQKENELKASQATKLFALGMHPSFLGAAKNNLSGTINEIYKAIRESSQNSQLLVILQENQKEMLTEQITNPGLFVRFIKKFAPLNMATVKDQNDMPGYAAIFSEFTPKIQRQQNKTFKFES